MAKTAAEYGQTHLALTDHGHCDNAINFMKACEKYNIKPIYGCEFYVVEDAKIKVKGENRTHLIALAKNETGFQNILKMVTKSNLEYSYFRPRIDPELLLKNSEGIIISTACSASFIRHGWGRELLEALLDKQREDIYGELMPHLLKDQLEINELVLELQKKYNYKTVSTCDSHYCLPEHAICQEVVLAIQSNKRWNDPDRWRFNGNSFYLMSKRDMSKEYMNQNQLDRETYMTAMDNTMEVAEKIEFHKIEAKEVSLPKVAIVGNEDDFTYLERECWSKLADKDFASDKVYQDRLKEELALIKSKNFERYFLILQDLLGWCRKENIMVGPGRGCFIPSTLIQKDDGTFIKISEIVPGDNVINLNSEEDVVESVLKYSVKESMTRIKTFFQIEDLICTNDHKILVNRRKKCLTGTRNYCDPNCNKKCKKRNYVSKKEWIAAKDLTSGDMVCLPREKFKKKSPIKIDLLKYAAETLLYADENFIYVKRGYNHKNTTSVRIKYLTRQYGFSGNTIRDIIRRKTTVRQKTLDRFLLVVKKEGFSDVEDFIKNFTSFETIKVSRFLAINEDFLRVLGMYIGNGWIRESETGIAFHSEQVDKINFVSDYVKKTFNCNLYHTKGYKGKKVTQVMFNLKIVSNLFSSLIPSYAINKTLPYFWKELDEIGSLSLLQGLIETDGCIKSPDGRISYDSINFDLVSQIRSLLLKFGIPSVLSKRSANADKSRPSDSYKLRFRMDYFLEIKNKIVVKYHLVEDDYVLVPIREISSENYEGEVYDLSVKNKPSYTTSNCIVHNSSSGSLVCFLLGIVSVDPIKHKLLFFRFLSPDRIDLPDCDTDISHIDRYRVRQRLEELYGKNNVASVSTFSVLRGRAALRDTGRVFEVPLQDINKACNVIEKKIGDDEGNDHTVEEALTSFDDGKEFYEKYPEVSKLAIAIEGTERNRGVHAAALVVADNDLTDGTRCSLILGKDKENTINWDKNNIEHQGLCKIDVLGLKMLSVLNYAKELIKQNHGVDIIFEEIPLNDERSYKEFSKANTTGCFQLGSTNIKKFCKQLGIDTFDTLVAATSLFRPGPLNAGSTEIYARRKNGEETVPQIHPILDEITKDTYGTIIYQETLMLIMYRLAGMEWKTVDKVRKLVAKSRGADALRKYEEEFVQGCIKNKTLREDQALSLWNDLVGFGQYGFNLSHAVAYSYITVWDMYLKVYYPVEFICALLTYGTDNNDMKEEYIEEAFRLGLDIRGPKIGISKADQWTIKNNILYMPYSEIIGVGDKTSLQFEKLKLNAETKGFAKKEEKSPVSTRFLNILEKIGAYEDKPLTDEEADNVSQYLGVSLVRNKLFKYKKLIKLISTNLKISNLKDVNIHDIETEHKYYFGLITELNLSTKTGKSGKYNIASASFKDGTGDARIGFDSGFYQSRVSEVEHCESEIIIIKANCPKRAGSLVVADAWFQQDIMNADLETLYLGLAENRRYLVEGIDECTECDNCNKCRKKTKPKNGNYNIMVVGETGSDNNDQLWRELKQYDFISRDFYVTSAIKCEVPAKGVTKKEVDICMKYLEEEIDNVRPFLILSIGNVGLKAFTDQETGIQSKNGTIEYNERYGCWILYCLSPASVFYETNVKPFKETIKIFQRKIKDLGLVCF